jgi:hypothetical protein
MLTANSAAILTDAFPKNSADSHWAPPQTLARTRAEQHIPSLAATRLIGASAPRFEGADAWPLSLVLSTVVTEPDHGRPKE